MEDQFKTADICLAATIIATLGTHLIKVKTCTSGNNLFVFPKADILNEFIEAFERGDLRVEPVIYSLVLSFLAEQVAEAKKNQ